MFFCLVLAAAFAACQSIGPRRLSVDERLARLGLEIVTDASQTSDAAVRVAVKPGAEQPALVPHPAGYSIIAAGDPPRPGRGEILRAIERAEPGSRLRLVVRREPALPSDPDFWELKLTVVVP